jgi:hypothetical protein
MVGVARPGFVALMATEANARRDAHGRATEVSSPARKQANFTGQEINLWIPKT